MEGGKDNTTTSSDSRVLASLACEKTNDYLTVITPCKSHSSKSRDEEHGFTEEDFVSCGCEEGHSENGGEETASVAGTTSLVSGQPCGQGVCARSKVISLENDIEEEENVCSICLDEFTDEDPSSETRCGHGYHLQCIMQWAQRSRECPLCFEHIALVDEDLNSLLPFGEYVSPQQRHMESSMIANMQLETFLIQLAAVERREHRRELRMRVSQESSSGGREEDRGHVVLTSGAYTPPREDSVIRNASLSLKSVKDKFASLFFSKPHSESTSPPQD